MTYSDEHFAANNSVENYMFNAHGNDVFTRYYIINYL